MTLPAAKALARDIEALAQRAAANGTRRYSAASP